MDVICNFAHLEITSCNPGGFNIVKVPLWYNYHFQQCIYRINLEAGGRLYAVQALAWFMFNKLQETEVPWFVHSEVHQQGDNGRRWGLQCIWCTAPIFFLNKVNIHGQF